MTDFWWALSYLLLAAVCLVATAIQTKRWDMEQRAMYMTGRTQTDLFAARLERICTAALQGGVDAEEVAEFKADVEANRQSARRYEIELMDVARDTAIVASPAAGGRRKLFKS